MGMIDAIGYAAFVLNVTGNLMLTHKSAFGWLVRLVTNVVWIAYALQVEGGGPMWVNHATFFFINVYGWRRWTRDPSD